ncbi:MAG: hypothetical protein HY901_05255 [Deltaproteobacteria bacterium]|nr:hypothetical protein [Deltaproteobacteria bacterium]
MNAGRLGLLLGSLLVAAPALGSEPAAETYERTKAKIVEEDRVVMYGGWGSIVAERPWFIMVDGQRVSHLAFAKRLSLLNDQPVPQEMLKLYEPERPRIKGLTIGGFVLGGVGLGAGLIMSMMGGLDTLNEPNHVFPEDMLTYGLVTLGASAMVMVATVVYTALTTTPRSPDSNYYQRGEANEGVERYNQVLRKDLGLSDAPQERRALPFHDARALPRRENGPATPLLISVRFSI